MRHFPVLLAPMVAALYPVHASEIDYLNLTLPVLGDHTLHVITPTLLEVTRLNSKPPGAAPVDSWDFVDANSVFHAPAFSQFAVTVDGVAAPVTAVGFKRRPLYAPVLVRDLRIENSLYLQLSVAIAEGQIVEVKNPGGALWTPTEVYSASTDALRYSPAIHVNQEGYVPGLPKKAMVGYYLGSLGELDVAAALGFKIVTAGTGTLVYQGALTVRADIGYVYSPTPYQKVLEADFSGVTTPGQYQLVVPGLGASLPFAIDEGIAMGFLRTYALGLYEQRCGTDNVMPFTRFIHDVCHYAPAEVPWPAGNYSFTWSTIAGKNGDIASNPRHTAPQLTSDATSLYPFVNHGAVDVSGGHHDAGDYSKYTTNSAELAHLLMFTADAIPGSSALDNLGLPESGDGISDILQEAKRETDYLAKLQDADGGFYFIVYPKTREYESNVLPEHGDAQVVWPKNTAATAAAVAALAQAASSPKFKAAYPAVAALYLKKAKLGWQFLLNAIATHGKDGSYQKITFYGDNYMHDDELAWAACELFVATGEAQYRQKLFEWFPDPSDSLTFRWGWWRMSECWGNAIRSYAFAVRNGRLQASQLDAAYLAQCEAQIVAAGDDALRWSNQNSYATSFPEETKHVQGAGWYFSLDQASDMAVAYQVSPKPAYIDALVGNMNYEAGTNPVNVTYLTGLGQKRQREIVSQYALNDRRVLPPTGIPLGNIQTTFAFLDPYGSELRELAFPSDSAVVAPYQFYDRWADSFNVSTEYIGVNQARSLLALTVLATRTTTQSQAWKSGGAQITTPASVTLLNSPTTLTVQAPGFDLSGARIVWEARDQEPAFGATYTISPKNNGPQWVEVEATMHDGRRVFAVSSFNANSTVVNWVDGAVPTGGVIGTLGGDAWTWVTPTPATPSGRLAHRSNLAAGEHAHWFDNATATMQVGLGDEMFAWVYLDPLNPPTEVMLTWTDRSTEHRAYWGANTITWGNNNSPGRYPAGALPPTGQWVRLSVPASAVGLAGSTVVGMAFVLVDGRATWDIAGITTSVAPATAPTIIAQPQPQTTTVGASATFSVVANGTAPLAYQWSRNNATLAGATSATLTLTNVQVATAGLYGVVVSNAVGSASSTEASLTVNAGAGAPGISTQPHSQAVASGTNVTFTVAATGTALTYQWTHNGFPITGATSPSFTITGAAAVRDNGWYQAIVTNASGSTSSAAAFVTVAVSPSQIVGWGRNVEGETSVPGGLVDAISVAAGGAHAIALTANGSVVAWGRNAEGQTTVPAGLNTVVALAAGLAHSVALKADGSVVAWGSNDYGQLATPAGLANVVSIAAGDDFTLALKNDGTVVAWGDNASGQATVPLGLSNVVGIAAGSAHALVLKGDGTVVAWGYDGAGQATVPDALAGVVSIAAGNYHSVALRSDGTVIAWGWNGYGQTTVPLGLSSVTGISAGGAHTLAQKVDGSVAAWGDNTSGQVTIPVSAGPVIRTAAGRDFSLALRDARVLPVITTQPASQSILAGQPVTFSVVATATPPPTLQWRKAGNAIAGAINASYTIAATVVADAGSYDVIVTNSAGALTSSTAILAIGKVLPVITWPAPATIIYGVALSATQLNATTSVPGTFVYNPLAGVVLSAGTAQTLSVTFTPTDTANYSNATRTTPLTVSKATPTITWPTPSAIVYGAALSATQLNATTGIAGTFAYSPVAGVVLGASAGQALGVTFTPTNALDYNNATAATTLAVNQALPVITWPTPAAISSGVALSATQLNATASTAGAFAYTPPAGTVLSAGAGQPLGVTFTPTDAANYSTATAATTITVGKITPTITWPAPAAIVYGAALSATQLNATASVAGTFVYTPAAGTVLNASAAQALSVTFTPANTTNYNNATAANTLTVTKATQTVTFVGPANMAFVTTGFALSATASSTLVVAFSVVSGPATLSGSTLTLTGAGLVTVRASQPGNANVLAATDVDRPFTVSTNFASWEASKFTPAELSDPAKTGPNAVFGLDGFSNLVKYALGLEPKQEVVAGLPEVSVQGSDWVDTYTRPTALGDLVYTAEVSTNLATWTTAGVTHELVSTAAGVETWRARYPLASAANVFFRLKVMRSTDTSYAPPVGGMTINAPAAQTTSVSLPLLHASAGAGTLLGRVGAVGVNFLDVPTAGWTPGGLSAPANPYYVRFRTGTLAGRVMPVASTANTATRLFVNTDGTDLASAGVATGAQGDAFELILADTLNSLFGSTTLQGGATDVAADTVQVWGGGSWTIFYYNTTRLRWETSTDIATSLTRNNFVLRPDRGFMLTRRAAALKIYVTGRVPEVAPKYFHTRPGTTFVSVGVPATVTLGSLALQTQSGWQAGATPDTAATTGDLVDIWGGGSWTSFYFDSALGYWRTTTDVPTSLNRNNFAVPAGRPMMIRRLTSGGTIINLSLPYSFAP